VKKNNYGNNDLEFMSSLSAAVLEKSEKSSRIMLYVIFFALSWLIIWAYFAEIDEVTKGDGKVIPFGQVQVIQNLEGGIVKDILVAEGDSVKINQTLIKIDNKQFESNFEQNSAYYDLLYAKAARLKAEAGIASFALSKQSGAEYDLYQSNKQQLKSKVDMFENQLEKKALDLQEARGKVKSINENYALMTKEIVMTEPLVKKGIASEVDYLKLKRDANRLVEELDGVKISIPKLEAEIKEIKNRLIDTKLEAENKARRELSDVVSELSKLEKQKMALSDQVLRTEVKSPVDGTIKRLFVNTIGGVIKPGMDIVEIVPSAEKLVIEAKIKPSDIAFIRPELNALVKFTAYDFSIYGGLEGKVTQISADTITDRKENSFYLVRIEIDENSGFKGKKKLEIIPGMTVSVDIMTGKKTILDYILKPIIKAKNNALKER